MFPDRRLFDAYVVYQMQSPDKVTEDALAQFVARVLPSILEDRCGYRLFIHGRDAVPGEGHLMHSQIWTHPEVKAPLSRPGSHTHTSTLCVPADRLGLVEDRMKQSRRLMVILAPGSGSESESSDQQSVAPQSPEIGGFDWQVVRTSYSVNES